MPISIVEPDNSETEPASDPLGENAPPKRSAVSDCERWERVRDALPRLDAGPQRRACWAIEWLIDSAIDVASRPCSDPEWKAADERIKRAVSAVLGRDWESQVTIMLIAQIMMRAIESMDGIPPERGSHFGSRYRPEQVMDPSLFFRAADAWRANIEQSRERPDGRRSKRVSVWQPVADALASAGLAIRSPESLARMWRNRTRAR